MQTTGRLDIMDAIRQLVFKNLCDPRASTVSSLPVVCITGSPQTQQHSPLMDVG